jgi:hypothetical protein
MEWFPDFIQQFPSAYQKLHPSPIPFSAVQRGWLKTTSMLQKGKTRPKNEPLFPALSTVMTLTIHINYLNSYPLIISDITERAICIMFTTQ